MLLKCETVKAGKKEGIIIPLEIGTLIGTMHIYLKKLIHIMHLTKRNAFMVKNKK